MQQTVRLLGDLGERYGAEHQYHNLRSPSEAIKLLCVNYPALQKELTYAHEQGIGYKVIQAGLELDYDDLALPLGQNDLIVTPVVAGSGGGAGKILTGIALVATAIALGPLGGGFLGLGAGIGGGGAVGVGFLTAAASTGIGAIGTSLVLGGVADIISPQPQLPSFDGFDGAQRFGGQALGETPQLRGVTGGQSYAYNGAANVAGVGTVIPVAYGTVLIGSALLSARIEVTNEGSDPENNDPLNKSVVTPGPGTITVGGEKLTTAFTDISGGKVQLSEITINDSNQNDFKRYFNTFIELSKGNSQTFFIPKIDNGQLDKLDIIFRLQRGLYDRVSGANTTKTYGSITYRIEAYSDQIDDQHLTHRSETRIYGLLDATDPNASEATRATQKFRYRHRVKFSNVEGGDNDLYVKITIVDFDAFLGDDGSPKPALKVHAVGLNM